MFDWFRTRLLSLLRVPANPQPPLGAPGSARVFRAARNYYKLRLLGWSVTQAATLLGIVFSLTLLAEAKREADEIKSERHAAALAAREAAADPSAVATSAAEPPAAEPAEPERRTARQHAVRDALKNPLNPLGRVIERSPWWLFPLIAVIEFGGILLYLAQIPVTYALVRLEFESHWYIVTDRSLRIRSGLVSMKESTMSFANVQQVTVSQGPLQRLLGIADVRVQSAGGGGGSDHDSHSSDSMHTGIFHGVDNAAEVRDLILERLRVFRAAGLGDPEDHHREGAETPAITEEPATQIAIVAARELLAEARALRASIPSER